MTIEDFKKKYGIETFGLLVGKFILESPDFPGGNELAREIGRIMGDLDSVLREIPIKK